MPIIKKFEPYIDYPFEAIDPPVQHLLDQIVTGSFPHLSRRLKPILRLIECYLQITNQKLSLDTFSSPEFPHMYRTFLGALNSDSFIERAAIWRYSIAYALNAFLVAVHEKLAIPLLKIIEAKTNAVTEEIQICVTEFERLPLNEEKVWLWTGWSSNNLVGVRIYFPLYAVYKRLGREFTNELSQVCATYVNRRRTKGIKFLKSLATFIGQYEKPFSAIDLRNPQFTTFFWREFFEFYLINEYADGNGAEVPTLLRVWNCDLRYFVSQYLEPSELFAPPWGQFPSKETERVAGSNTNIRRTDEGYEVKTKLITPVPLNVSDEQALKLLFYQIEADVGIFVKWAEAATADLWHRHTRRITLAKKGLPRTILPLGEGPTKEPRTWLTDRSNPEHLQNAAATFHHHGFLTMSDQNLRILYPKPICQTAFELGFPTTDALYPHCLLLVADHPRITPAFLEKLELFDSNCRRTGFIETDGGWKLVGYKYRNGPKHSKQDIVLSERGVEIVKQVIAITEPLRRYLRERNDDGWRRLFLTCGKGFGYPVPMAALAQATTIPARTTLIAESLGNTCELDFEKRLELAKGFSLTALRASVGVLVYIETGSAEEMAKALGHTEYQPRLLACYLPEPILNFFQERWVRIFQTGIIVEALMDSEHLLQATEFRDMGELDEFLKHHALRVLPPQVQDTQMRNSKPSDQVVFGVSTGILTTMLSLALAVRQSIKQVCGRAKYWAGVTDRLVAYLETELAPRADLQQYLAVARENADPSLMAHLLYE